MINSHNSVTESGAYLESAPALEPIAIIGVGCRFPGGANDASSYWNLLSTGTDAISETPPNRWNLQKFYADDQAQPGKTQSRWGGYVADIDQFDPQLFGISPREAASMDPQQRMLLEVAYRALEDGGQPVEQVAGHPVSVFVGISSFDYAVASLSFRDRGVINAYSNTGGSSSIAANRISYCFDLRGPSVAVDTACSSSLVALHMACESLWQGSAEMALAGGVNALLMPDFYVAFSQLGVLSPDGRCKTFDARANGYVRSEGAGMVLLKPLRAAIRDGDPVYAVVRSTALNQDGRTPGMTVPSQSAQEALIRAACQRARVEPGQLSYVEAHGTGTPVGDPIETSAIGAVVGAGRVNGSRCLIGSVKTNIGHLEAGAGIASVIKVALSLHQRRVPAHLHFEQANPAIDFDRLGLTVPTQTQDWSSTGTRLAGINGFGYGGANAHVILEQAPEELAAKMPPAERSTVARRLDAASAESASESPAPGLVAPVLLPLSAHSSSALASQAENMADWLEQTSEYSIAEVAGYCAHRRTHQSVRVGVSATSAEQLQQELRSLAATQSGEFAEDFPAVTGDQLAFVCSGQGPQWWAMGRGLLRYSPAFRQVIKRCDAQFAQMGDWSLLEELSRDEASSRMQQTSMAQPSIFAIQVALAEVWKSWGIRPAAIVGHSVGEIAAAYLSGALSWEDACCVAFHRGRTMDLASSQGAMVAAGLSADEVPRWLQGIEDQVALAAINGPSSVTISGDSHAIEDLAQRLDDQGVFCRRLAVEYAFHSPQMDPVRDELLRSLAHISPGTTHTQMISTVTGQTLEGPEVNADYWWRNVRQSVRFSDAMECLAAQNFRVCVEIGPHPVLAYSINECFQAANVSVRTTASLNRQQDDLQCITKSLGQLYGMGLDVDWSGFYTAPQRKVPVPNFPFQKQRCWSESIESQTTRLAEQDHPLLGERTDHPQPVWQQRIDLKLQSYLADHCVRGACVYPAAAMIETALAAATRVHEQAVARLENLELLAPCSLADERPQWLETSYDAGRRQLALAVRDCEETEWRKLATVHLSSAAPLDAGPHEQTWPTQLRTVRQRCTEGFDQQRLYEYCQLLGLHYGEQFRGIVSGLRRDGEALVEVCLAKPTSAAGEISDYLMHPALLDSCFHAMIAADPTFDHTIDGLYLPTKIREISFYRRPSARVTVHARVLSKTRRSLICNLHVFDDQGRLCLAINEFESRRVSGGISAETTEDLIYSYSWVQQDLPPREVVEPGDPTRWLVFVDESGLGGELVSRLQARGDQVQQVFRGGSAGSPQAPGHYVVDPQDQVSFQNMLRQAAAAGPVDRMVYLWGLDVPDDEQLDASSLDVSTDWTTLAPLYLVQAWDQVSSASAELSLVTSGAQSQDGAPELTRVAQSPLIGLGRVIVSEYANFRTQLIDLPAEILASDIDDLITELLRGDEEDEVLWRRGRRFVHRFAPQSGKPASTSAARHLPCRLALSDSAGVEELRYQTQPVLPLRPGQVEIEVRATGLNFSDVMKALDLYPGLPDGPVDLGAECSGRISRVGPDCQWSVDDEVIAVAPGAFGTHVTVDAALVARKPSHLSHAQAATIPIAFLTADYALHHCARLQAGDAVLVHSASGGVGLAALQLAKLANIQVYATAGTEEKRQYVRRQGAVHVMDSRSLKFADEIQQITDGHGIDAVLNSLPGEAIAKGLSVLKTGGRFLEIGKRDIYSDHALGLYPFRNNLSLFAIDLDQLFKQQPQRMGDQLRALVQRFESGELEPLPFSAYAADETKSAFRFMQQGKHIGKVIVNYDQRPQDVQAGSYAPLQLDADATYWIAGGLGGFGLEVCRWMVQRGARHLVVSGRSRQLRAEAQAVMSELIAQGVRIAVMPADITQVADVQRVVDTIAEEMPPLKGVIHCAMVLEDKLLVDLDRDTLQRVLRPKVLGGWNLHNQTKHLDLDLFVLFSSLSSVFGHAGQANYSAANALLDSLAYHRRAQGLPATVMNWGHLGEVGYLAEREQLGQRLERQGVLSFSVKQAMNCLEYALQNREIQLSVLRMDWSLWRGLGTSHRVSPRFAHLLRGQESQGSDHEQITAAGLRAADETRRRELVEQQLRAKAGSLLGIPASQITSDRALLQLGLDSLMAVEMRNWIENQMEINLAISILMRSDSLGHLTSHICEAIAGDGGPLVSADKEPADSGIESSSISGVQAEALLEQLPNLGTEEVSQLLGQMLREQES